MTTEKTWMWNPKVACRTLDGTAFILLNSRMLSLNEVGTFLWDRLEEGASLEHLVGDVLEEFATDETQAKEDAQVFHYYLTRHTHLDEESHGPLALRMITRLCGDDPVRKQEALDTAANALHARYIFWDKVHKAIIEIPG